MISQRFAPAKKGGNKAQYPGDVFSCSETKGLSQNWKPEDRDRETFIVASKGVKLKLWVGPSSRLRPPQALRVRPSWLGAVPSCLPWRELIDAVEEEDRCHVRHTAQAQVGQLRERHCIKFLSRVVSLPLSS